jgi:hypothetical protein
MMGSAAKGRTVMEVGADGVALITIIHPPVNALSFDGTFSITPLPRSFPFCLFPAYPFHIIAMFYVGFFFSSYKKACGGVNFGTLCLYLDCYS